SCPDPRPGSAWPGRLRRGPSRPRRAVRPGQKPACRLAGRSGLAFPAWLAVWSGGQHPDSVVAGQAPAGQVPQVQGGGAALEPGVVPGHPAVAELEAASPPGGDLGDGAFDVGPVFHVVLAQPGAGGPVPAGGAQQVVALVQDELAAGLAGGAPLAQRAAAAQRAEGGGPGPAQAGGVPSRAGHRALLFVDGEVVDGEPALDGGRSGLGLITASCPAFSIASRRSPVPLGGIAVPGKPAAAVTVAAAAVPAA